MLNCLKYRTRVCVCVCVHMSGLFWVGSIYAQLHPAWMSPYVFRAKKQTINRNHTLDCKQTNTVTNYEGKQFFKHSLFKNCFHHKTCTFRYFKQPKRKDFSISSCHHQPCSDKGRDLYSSAHQPRKVPRGRRVHVGTVGSAIDEDGRQLIGDVLRDPQHVPWIDGAVGKDYVGHVGGYVLAPVITIGFVHRLKDG